MSFVMDAVIFDLVIIGGGPIGIAIAQEFSNIDIKILLIESGGLPSAETAGAQSGPEDIGERRDHPYDTRQVKAFGGTSNVWSGRCTTLNAIDFEKRDWVPFSGWPVTEADIAPYLPQASAVLGVGNHVYDESLWREINPKSHSPLRSGELHSQFWQYSRDHDNNRDFARPGPRFLAKTPKNCTIMLNSTVVGLVAARNGLPASIDIIPNIGLRHTVQSRRVVLCAGGLENARLLLASWRQDDKVSPRVRANVGRFLMDHPRATIGVFDGKEITTIAHLFGLYRKGFGRNTRFFTHGVKMAPAKQRSLRLLNCAAWVTEVRSADDPWEALKRVINGPRRTARDLALVSRNLPTMVGGFSRSVVRNTGVVHRCDELHLDCLVEQVPDPESRLILSDRIDRWGLPIARVDWRINDLERASVLHLSEIILAELSRLNLPRPRLSPGFVDGDLSRIVLRDVAHPMGTTRMTKEPDHGVVDENCRVHGLEGLYVAGTSIFPTGGHANPTLMAMALALRLADHLKETAFKCT